jgi:signal peptidase II
MSWPNSRISAARGLAFFPVFRAPPAGLQLLFFSVAAAGLAADIASKRAVFDWLSRRATGTFTIVEGFLRLIAVENSGAAFGIASGRRGLLVIVSVLALLLVLAVFYFGGTGRAAAGAALGLFAAGVAGNLYDRLFNDGCVRDFIDVVYWPGRHWPAFNLADTMLCAAVVLMVFSANRAGDSVSKPRPPDR